MPTSPSLAFNCLFLHGFLGTPEDWNPFVSPHCSSTFLTLPGHQFSPLPQEKPLLSYIFETIHKQIQERKVTLVGYSLGGRIALQFAKTFPDLIESLVILSANPGLETDKNSRILQDQKWAKLLLNKGIGSFIKKWYSQPLFANLKPELLNKRTHHDPASLARILTELSPAILPSCWNHLQNFPFKTLFLFGQHDVKYLKIARRIKEMGRSTKVDLIPNAGHAIHLENPTECQNKINQFLNVRT